MAFEHPDAIALREAMIAELALLYDGHGPTAGRDGSFGVEAEAIVATVLVYDDDVPVGHAALRRLDGELEIKRMYVVPSCRGRGVSEALLADIEQIAHEHSVQRVILHTGGRQSAAIAFYQRHGYTPILVYPPYLSLAESLCFEKVL